tara:strand:+ start:859 stop:1011 length:153 start_codon:yes stop_codon:yes gene_type:complete
MKPSKAAFEYDSFPAIISMDCSCNMKDKREEEKTPADVPGKRAIDAAEAA